MGISCYNTKSTEADNCRKDENQTRRRIKGRRKGTEEMKRLIEQIVKFGVVGFFCFFIDFGITTGMTNICGVHYLISKFLGFVISAVVNYLLSVRFVFTRKKEMDRKKEFTIFLILSAVGLVINEIVMYLCIDGLYAASDVLKAAVSQELMVSISSVAATAVVMVYNFISRKLFLERK